MLVFAVLLVSCSTDEEPKSQEKLPWDQALMKTSPLIAQIKAQIDYRAGLSCQEKIEWEQKLRAPDFERQDEKTRKGLRQVFTTFKNWCELYTSVQDSTKPVFDKIRTHGLVRRPLFVFSVFESAPERNDYGKYITVNVGPWFTMESCAEIEPLAWKSDVPITRCHEWDEPFVVEE